MDGIIESIKWLFFTELQPYTWLWVKLIISVLFVVCVYLYFQFESRGNLGVVVACVAIIPALWCVQCWVIDYFGFLRKYAEFQTDRKAWGIYWLFTAVLASVIIFKYSRRITDFIQKFIDKFTQRSLDKEKSTEEIFSEHDKIKTKPYNPVDFFRVDEGLIFHSLTIKGEPIYSNYNDLIKKSHGNSTGKSQMGKNVAIQCIVVQLLLFNELVVMCDAKSGGDDVMPPILKKYADEYKKPYNYVELSLSAPYQFNILQIKDVDFLKQILMQLAKLGETDDMAVGHHIGKDDATAQRIAFFVANSKEELTLHDIMTTHFTEFFNPDAKEPTTLETALKTAANKPCINAKNGFKYEDILNNGGVFYIQTSTKDDNTILSVMISSLRYVRSKLMIQRVVTVIADEFMKYGGTQDFIDIFTEGAGKSFKLITAYQTSALLEAKAIGKTSEQMLSVIMANNNYEYLYGTRDPLVLDIFEEHYCGTRETHEETTDVETSFLLADKTTGVKRLKKTLVARYPKELLTKLRTGEHFLYRAGELLELCYNGYLPLMSGKFDKNAPEFVELLKSSRTLTLATSPNTATIAKNEVVNADVPEITESAQNAQNPSHNPFL
jgi:hypothetical protein